ncbi:OmpA family protein [Kiloniella sp. b19]|uniref:OmpA family protein n=1 Tax=Kiloniella sp. GXU_MW_B19 TaxID=3141326 RepID=UPI0031D0FDA5
MTASKKLALLLMGTTVSFSILASQTAPAAAQGLNQGTVIIGGAHNGLTTYSSTPVTQYQSGYNSAPGLYPYTTDAQSLSRPANLYYPPQQYPRSLTTVPGFSSSANLLTTERTPAPQPTVGNVPAASLNSSVVSSAASAQPQPQAVRKPSPAPKQVAAPAPKTVPAPQPAPAAEKKPVEVAAVKPATPAAKPSSLTADEIAATAPVQPKKAETPKPVQLAKAEPTPAAKPAPKKVEPVPNQPTDITAALTPPPALDDVSTPSSSATSGLVSPLQLGFADQSSDLTAGNLAELDKLAAAMQADESLTIQLLAYAKGSDEEASQARRLSLSRALAVRGILMDRGIRSTRMQVRALGNKATSGNPDRVEIIPVAR